MSSHSPDTQPAVRAGITQDGRYVVTLGGGVLFVCVDAATAGQAANAVKRGLHAGIAGALTLEGVRLATDTLQETRVVNGTNG